MAAVPRTGTTGTNQCSLINLIQADIKLAAVEEAWLGRRIAHHVSMRWLCDQQQAACATDSGAPSAQLLLFLII